jgi:RyR domain
VTYTEKEIAAVAWAANAELQAQHGDPAPSLPGDLEDAEAHAVTVVGIRAILEGATPEQLHETWMRAREAQGWTLGPAKDSRLKTHPAMVPYADLPEHQRVKDRVFIAIVLAMAGQPERDHKQAPCGHEYVLGGVAYACERAPHEIDGYGLAFRHAAEVDGGFAKGTDEGDGHGPATLATWGEDSQGEGQDWEIAWGSVEAYGNPEPGPLAAGPFPPERHYPGRDAGPHFGEAAYLDDEIGGQT